MRIAHVTPVYPPQGGIGTAAKRYADGLRSRGDKVFVFAPRYRRTKGEEGVTFLSGWFSWGNACFVPTLLWKLRGFDVIHLHYPFYGGAIFTALASVVWRIPLVTTYHMKTKAEGWLGMIFRLHRSLLEPFILRASKNILVSSQDYGQSVGLRLDQVVEVPFSVDVDRFSPEKKEDIRCRFDISESTMTFLFVGGMDEAHYFKGVGVLLRACRDLPRDSDWRVLLVGSGNRLAQFELTAESYGLKDRMVFAGFVSDEELPSYYQSADVHILPSVDRSEAFGLVTLEAAASGTMSMVSDLPGVRTLVEDGHTGKLLKPGSKEDLVEKMQWAIDHKKAVKSMGEAARDRIVLVYSDDTVLDRLQEVYRRCTV